MQSPATTGQPPDVPIRHTRWPGRKTPRWAYLAALVLLAGAVLVGIAVRPTRPQRAADLNAFLRDVTFDVQSCAGGVRESLGALRTIQSGNSHDVKTAVYVATYGASNCSPANNELLGDLVQYQVHESLSSFRLDRAITGLVHWASPDAEHVQQDVAAILGAHGARRAAATGKLQRDLRTLDAQRAQVYSIISAAITATGSRATPPALPG